MTFGSKLQKLRTEAGLSQEELASRLNVSRQAVSKWELGKTMPDVTCIVAISGLFSVTTDYLLKEDESGEPVPMAAEEVSVRFSSDRVFDDPEPTVRAAELPTNRSDPLRLPRLLLVSGASFSLTATLLYLVLYCCVSSFRAIGPLVYFLMGAVLLGLPVLLAVSRCLLGGNAPESAELAVYRRLFALCAALWGFAIAVLCGFQEVVDDLLIDQVNGVVSIPLFLVLLMVLGATLYGAGVLLAKLVTRSARNKNFPLD